MSLTGLPFILLVSLFTVGAFVAAVLLWPRMSRSRVQDLLARVGLLVVVNALSLLTAATLLNNEYGFYADWSDLATSFAGTAVTSTVGVELPRGSR